MRIHTPVIVTLPSTIAAAAVVEHQGQPAVPGPQKKPVIVEHISPAHSGPAGDSLQDMVLVADLVVVGRIGRSEYRVFYPLDGYSGDVVTIHAFRVEEVLHVRGGGAVGEEIPIGQMGGFREHPDHIEHVVDADFPTLGFGRRYVIFLTWSSFHSAWLPRWSPNGVFDVEGDRVEPVGKAPRIAVYRGRQVKDFLDAVRAVGHRR
jgi:hypothetical protein